MKQCFLMLYFFCVVFISFAQTMNQNLVSPSGNFYQNLTNNMSFSIGETIIDTYKNNNNTITSGFHQSYFIISTIENNFSDKPFLFIYPNPVKDHLNIKFIQTQTDYDYNIDVYNMQGKKLQTIINYADFIQINLHQYAVSNYIIIIKNNLTQESISYKVQKIE
jgi:hypothetical protein